MTNVNLQTELNNRVTLIGAIAEEPGFDHQTYGRSFYKTTVTVIRKSGTVDRIPVMIPDDACDIESLRIGDTVKLTGYYKSVNQVVENVRHLILYMYAKTVEKMDPNEIIDMSTNNLIQLTGFICKEPVFRTTPLGKEITDIMLAVNHSYKRTNYIPCIVWGRLAQEAKDYPVGTCMSLTGRIQSREYKKVTEKGAEPETRTAYEISVREARVGPGGTIKNAKYFEIYVKYGSKENEGYSIALAAEDKEAAKLNAISQHLFECEDDEAYINYIKEVTKEEYEKLRA